MLKIIICIAIGAFGFHYISSKYGGLTSINNAVTGSINNYDPGQRNGNGFNGQNIGGGTLDDIKNALSKLTGK